MVRRGLAWSWALCALLCACGKTDQGEGRPGGAASSGGATAELAAWSLAVAEALCIQDSSCPVLTPRMYPSFEACVDEKHTSLAGYFQYYAGLDHYAEQASVLRLGSLETRQGCLEGLAACKTWADSGCDNALVPRGRAERGESCASDSWTTPTPCDDGLFCSGTFGCSMCLPKAHEGEACSDRPCETGLYCHRTYIVMGDTVQDGPTYCDRARQSGETCGEMSNTSTPTLCGPGLVCSSHECRVPTPGGTCQFSDCPTFYACVDGTCARLEDGHVAGEACPHGAGCAGALTCTDEICTELAPEGAPCQRAPFGERTGCQRWCIFDTPDAKDGHCTSSPPTAAPTPCSIYRGQASMACPAGTKPNLNGDENVYPKFPDYCQCEPVGDTAVDAAEACH